MGDDIRILPNYDGRTVTSCYGCPFSAIVDKFDDLMCTLIDPRLGDDDAGILISVEFKNDDDEIALPIISKRCRLPKLVDGKIVEVVHPESRGLCPECRRIVSSRSVMEPIYLRDKVYCSKCEKDIEPMWRLVPANELSAPQKMEGSE